MDEPPERENTEEKTGNTIKAKLANLSLSVKTYFNIVYSFNILRSLEVRRIFGVTAAIN